MAGGEPALRPVIQWIVIETLAAGQREDTGLDMGLSNVCQHLLNGDAAGIRQGNGRVTLPLLEYNAHRSRHQGLGAAI